MSLTRNKRKRPENDVTAMAPASRRRSRDSRATSVSQDLGCSSNPSTIALTTDAESKTENISCDKDTTKTSQLVPDPETADPGTGSIDEGTTPRVPLHVSSGGDDAPNTSAENPDPDATDRTLKIRDLIAHRSLLLSRIRLCRSAADKRLVDTKAAAQTMGSTSGGPLREMTDDEEIESYREMSRLASQAAKRARGDGEAQAEKRTSLSLRRGSGVGKRMNAALSSLAPGTSSHIAGNSSPVSIQGPVATDGANFLKSTTVSGPPSMAPSEQLIPGQITGASQPSNVPKSAKAVTQRQSSFGGNDGKQIRPSAGKAFKSNTATIPRTSSVTKVDQVPTSTRPGHLVPSAPPRTQQPKPIFTKAVMLRQERDRIQAKLAELMERQSMATGVSVRESEASSNTHPAMSRCSSMEIPPKVELPKRRKTHWDRLLQEMSWLATDFIEERKWKMSSARAVSHSIISSGISVGKINATLQKSRIVAVPSKIDTKGTVNASIIQSTIPPEQSNDSCRVPDDDKKYPRPSSEDNKMAKKAARLASSMISELVVAVHKAGAMGSTDEFHAEALDRYTKVRDKLFNDTIPTSKPPLGQIMDTIDEGNSVRGTVQVHKEDMSKGDDFEDYSGEVTFSDISRRINDLGTVHGRHNKFSFKELATAVVGKKLKPSSDQKAMIEFVDGVWNNSSAGAMLTGIPTSGKTVATCCVLWKNRTHGPQLIICPPASMLRWKYEISLFKDLRVLNFGLVGGISCAQKGAFVEGTIPGPSDVILCEYSSVGRILSLVRKKNLELFSLCIDCRHPEGMFGSIASQKENAKQNPGWHGATELITAEWWDNIICLASRNGIRRLMIDYCDSDPYSLGRSGLGQRQQLEILSLRTAFLVGPRTFRPSNYSLPRTVISWARHQEKRSGEGKFERVRRVLQEAISPLTSCTRSPLYSFPFTTWEIRECEMPRAQRAAYDSCCSHIRGALSSSLCAANTQDDLGFSTYHAVASALFRLRQICLCSSHLDRVEKYESLPTGESLPFVHTEPCSVDATPTEAGSFKMASDNSSQPDHELAEVLLNNSGKFSQLVAILENECGHTPDCDKNVRNLIDSAWNEKLADTTVITPTRVVILANLPRTQWLVSILLGSLGIRHKLIRREFSHTSIAASDEIKKHKQAALSWAESQITLTAFNSEEEIRDKIGIYASADVLIVSPDSLASWHGGVGIENADCVISMDEDWSGREMGTLEAAMSRWKAGTSLQKSHSRTIRLICSKSIETRIFTKSKHNEFQCPLDKSGNHILYRDIDELVSIYHEAVESRAQTTNLPGLDVLQLRGEALKDVLLCSKELAPLFGTGSTMYFLPMRDGNEAMRKRDHTEMKRELFFLRSLFELECRETLKDLSASFTDSFTFTKKLHFGSGVLPPEPRSYPEHVMSRSDLQFLSIRYYFERQVILLGSSAPVPSDVSLGQFSLDKEQAFNKTVALTGNTAQNGSTLTDAWQKSGIGSKPDEMAQTLLCYNAKTERKALVTTNRFLDSSRYNTYSKIFSSIWNSTVLQDGSQGCEPLVFLPPVYPKIQLSPHPIKDLKHSQRTTNTLPGSKETQKRKEIDNSHSSVESESKRPRTDSLFDISDSPPETSEKMSGNVTSPSRKIAQNTEQSSARVTHEGTESLSHAASNDAARLNDDNHNYLFDDFGMLGGGALPLPVYTALLLANETTTVGKSSNESDDFVQNFLPCDLEEAEGWRHGNDDGMLRLMALHVKKRPRVVSPLRDPTGPPPRPHTGLIQVDQKRSLLPSVPSSDAAASSNIAPANGEESGKKAKKKTNHPVASSAFTRIPNTGINLPGITPGSVPVDPRGGQRHRMLATYASRQFGTGLSMFESVSYRTAMIHVQNRIRMRADVAFMKSILANDAGPGIPMMASNNSKAIAEIGQGVIHFGNIVQQLKAGACTGDASKSVSTTQRSALRRSMMAPCRVDFGPFEGGFLASPSGMTGMSPPRSRIGVSLPMGVKVASGTHDQLQPSWTAEEDKQLQETAVKFGMNWIIIARALSGVDGFVVTDRSGSQCSRRLAPPPRSSRQCRDRWQFLARNQPSLAGEVRKAEKILRENALKRVESLANEPEVSVCSLSLGPCNHEERVVLMCPASLIELNRENQSKMEIDEPPTNDSELQSISTTPIARPKKSFSILKTAMTKRQLVPLTFPGVTPGDQPSQPVPSHPSHMQSVQSSAAAQLSNGRTEMWPLQILDCADKHRVARASAAKRSTEAPAATVPARNPTTTSSSSSVVVAPTGALRAPPNNRVTPSSRPATTSVPNRAAPIQRPRSSSSSNTSPSKSKPTITDTGSQKQVVPKTSPVAPKSDASKTSVPPTQKS